MSCIMCNGVSRVVCSVRFSIDTNSLAVAVGSDGVVILYDLLGGQKLT